MGCIPHLGLHLTGDEHRRQPVLSILSQAQWRCGEASVAGSSAPGAGAEPTDAAAGGQLIIPTDEPPVPKGALGCSAGCCESVLAEIHQPSMLL